MPSPVVEPPAPPGLRREWPPALRLLLGEHAAVVWDAVLAPAGGRLVRLRPTGTSVQPGGAATVRYAAEVAWTGGRPTAESLVATTGGRIPAGATVVEAAAGGSRVPVGVWCRNSDPALPALAWASQEAAAADRLAALGLTRGPLHLRLRSYRPGRRAVVEVSSAAGTAFLKVVRPGAVGRLLERHEVLLGAVPVAPVLGATDDGAVVLGGLPGTPMRALLAGDGAGLPGARTLDALLDALPEAAAHVTPAGRGRPGDALGRVRDHATVLGTVLPDLLPRLERLASTLADADPGEHDDVPVHGDFYESHLLVKGGSVVGLLDVDTLGRGHRIDDWAGLLGHLALLETLRPAPVTVVRYRTRLQEAALRRWPAGRLRPRVAAVLLGLATGPFRALQADWAMRTVARVALAEQWAARPEA